MPTFHLSRREVRIGFWRCLLAFYASPGFFRRVRRAARRGKGSGIDVRVLLGILLNIALLAAKGVATDLRDRVARWRGRDPYFE
jgi:hypothetical protein